jgi:hypothetical protein
VNDIINTVFAVGRRSTSIDAWTVQQPESPPNQWAANSRHPLEVVAQLAAHEIRAGLDGQEATTWDIHTVGVGEVTDGSTDSSLTRGPS